jgi:peptidoglycan/LPS O-acetylase OafA/YrhL
MHYKQIDGLRFLAVTCVIFHHVFPLFNLTRIDLGFFGVNLFFVISGFLISEILIKQKDSGNSISLILKTFFIRRSLRIFPLYFLYILICYFIVPLQVNEYIYWLLSYSINIWIVLKGQLAFWYFTHLWSLSIEEQFYIIWPFIVLFIPKKYFLKSVLLLIITSIVIRLIMYFILDNSHLFNYTMLPVSLDCFGMGALLAYLKIKKNDFLFKLMKFKYLILVGLTLFVFNSIFGNEFMIQVFNRFLTALISFLLVGFSVTIEFKSFFKKLLENRLVSLIGKISYGMYIYHLLVWGTLNVYFNQFWNALNLNLEPNLLKSFSEFIFVFICTSIVSFLSFELFEKQVLKLKKYSNY